MLSPLRILEIKLNNLLIGHIGNYEGKNIFVPSPDYVSDSQRPTLSLAFIGKDEGHTRSLLGKIPSKLNTSNVKLPPFFSNLLPEGALRSRVVQQLKIHEDQEFDILAALGKDLPGAITAEMIERVPTGIRDFFGQESTTRVSLEIGKTPEKFSLSGVQLKFSVLKGSAERYTLAKENGVGSIIAKLPHPGRISLPENEFSSMTLAREVGVQTPKFWVEDIGVLEIPGIEGFVGNFYAIERFDRKGNTRIHMEDFGQVMNVRADRKYTETNYDTVAKIILAGTLAPLPSLYEFIRRLVVNILLGNGDAHLKNFTLLYLDSKRPVLSPAYDVVSTIQYMPSDTTMALNMAGEKESMKIGLEHFLKMGEKIGFPNPKALAKQAHGTVVEAIHKWPSLIEALPYDDSHKRVLLERLKNLPIVKEVQETLKTEKKNGKAKKIT